MLDVHPPHAGVHSWRDFIIHLATITIGLLIALGLEAAAEAVHHHNVVAEARANIRREIANNQKEVQKDLDYVQQNADNMKEDTAKARIMRDSPGKMKHGEMHFNFSWSSMDDAAWLSARDSGALTYMPLAEVQRYADYYNQQGIVNQQAVAIFTHEAEIAAPLVAAGGGDLRTDEAQTLMLDCATTSMRLMTLRQLMESLQKGYDDTLRK